ncbi:MAG: hypothetical protein A4S08_07005 [Proteobacteria bacterium SG_bin4]|nr:MAG: hypothetical protein A4S08_07005 [Proteobacteria bacterium SG_bin4]
MLIKKVVTITGLAVVFMVNPVFAHDPVSSLFLSNIGGSIAVRDVNGQPLESNIWQSFFGTEREWDERSIYNHVNAFGTPVDASGNAAYIGGSTDQPHLKGSDGTKNPLYNPEDFAWNYYHHAAALAVVPGVDGSLDNKPVRLELVSDLKVWNGSSFVAASGNSVGVSVWTWTRTEDDGIDDFYDTVRFPDGGWYAYPDGTVQPNGSLVDAGGYDFAPGDHYHWLLQLGGNRDAGVYALRMRFATADDSVGDSETFDVLIANGLGIDWEESTHHPLYDAAFDYLAANPDILSPVPESETWMMLLAGLGLVGWRMRNRSSVRFNVTPI